MPAPGVEIVSADDKSAAQVFVWQRGSRKMDFLVGTLVLLLCANAPCSASASRGNPVLILWPNAMHMQVNV
jgi:hypothetical protein